MNKDDSDKQSVALDSALLTQKHKHKHREQAFTHAISPLKSIHRRLKKDVHCDFTPVCYQEIAYYLFSTFSLSSVHI